MLKIAELLYVHAHIVIKATCSHTHTVPLDPDGCVWSPLMQTSKGSQLNVSCYPLTASIETSIYPEAVRHADT